MLKCGSKLNPLAEEFVPSSRRRLSADSPEFVPWGHLGRSIPSDGAQLSPAQSESSHAGIESSSKKDKIAEKGEKIKRTVYVGDIDPRITEEELLRVFSSRGIVKDKRICGDTRSGLRYGFVEFENEDYARAAMGLDCTRIGLYPVRVLPSRTSIVPLSRLPPVSDDDRDKVARTVYCSFIDKMLDEKDLKEFFESQCGEVSCVRFLSDGRSSTSYGFIEFAEEEFAMAAINCTGMLLGNFRIKVVSSKAPIRSREN